MPCCCPPRTTNVPISTLTRRFLTAASDPVVSCAQDPPSRDTFDSCARLCVSKLRGASRASTPANPMTCSVFFNSTTSLLAVTSAKPSRSSYVVRLTLASYLGVCLEAYRKNQQPRDAFRRCSLVDLRQLSQHCSRLR